MKRSSAWLLFLLFPLISIAHLRADCVYGLIIDTSGSMRPAIGQAVTGARLLIERSGPRERFYIVAFGEDAQLEQPATDEKKKLLSQLDNLLVRGYPSKILDVVFLSANEMKRVVPPTGCKALVLITDGDEQLSYYKKTPSSRRCARNS